MLRTPSNTTSNTTSQTVSTETIEWNADADRALAIHAYDRGRAGSGRGVRAVVALLLAAGVAAAGIAMAQHNDTAAVAPPTAQEPDSRDGHAVRTADLSSVQEPTVGQRVGRSGHPGARVMHLHEREPGIPSR